MQLEQQDAPPELAPPSGKAPLPGLTLVFFIGLCAGGGLCGACAFLALAKLAANGIWLYGAEAMSVALAIGGGIGVFLCWWAGVAVYTRKQDAPARCRILLAINMTAAAISIAGMIFLFVSLDSGAGSALEALTRSNLPGTIGNLLAAVIISEAWRRYFLFSPKVRQAFGLHRPPGHAAELPPAEIGLFTVICWLCPAHYGLPNIIWLAYSFSTIADGGIIFIALHAAITVSYLALPFVALYALRVRRGMLRVIFWCLSLWLALEAALWLANAVTLYIALAEEGGYQYTYGLPRLFSERLFIPLAFWWYFAVSQKARAWFGAADLPWAAKAVRL